MIRQRKPLQRSPLKPRTTWLPRPSKPIRKKKRPASEFARIYGSKERVAFVKSLPCVALRAAHGFPCAGRIENAHVGKQGAGMGRKGDADQIAPLCHWHHGYLHDMGAAFSAAVWNVDLVARAAATEAAWLAHSGGRRRG